MKESDLARAIDMAAEQRAKQLLQSVRDAVCNALKPYWRPDGAGRELISKDIRSLLVQMANADGIERTQVRPSTEMVDMCRADIVNGLLDGLPKLRELAQMAMQDDGDSEE